MTSSEFGLTFGDLDWSPAAQVGDVTVEVYGLNRGRPVPVVSVVQTLLQDGTSERVDREDNRDVTVLIGIAGADSHALAEYEATLRTEVARERNTLAWTPPDGFGATSVFDVLWADLQPFDDDGWDLDEVLRGRRLYALALRCLPFARSVDEVEVTATPTAASPTVVDAGTNAANWTNWYGSGGSADPSITDAAVTFLTRSAIQYTTSSGVGQFPIRYTGTAPSQVFFGIVIYGGGLIVTLVDNDTSTYYSPVATENDSGWWTYWFRTTDAGSTLDFLIGLSSGTWSAGSQIRFDGIVNSPGIGFASLVAVDVFGSVRTNGRYAITRSDGTGGLAWVTVFSDPAMANGAYHPAVPATWENAPEGTYAYWMDTRGGTVEVTVTDASGQSQTMTTEGPWTNPVIGDTHPDMLPIGELTLGGTYDGLVGTLSFEVKVNGIVVTPATTPRLFRKHRDTSLTHVLVDGDLADLATEVIIESPSVERPFGGVWADGASVIARCVSWEDPTFSPATTYLFVEADNSENFPVTTTAAYFPRHHTHATR